MIKSYKRHFTLPKLSFFLLGPRGTGKTTLLKQLNFADHHINLLNSTTFRRLSAHPSLLFEELETLKPGSTVVIDEVQKIPELLDTVHQLIEERHLRFALTGSSARKLKGLEVNLLGGRALKKTMYPLTPQEMKEDFNLTRALQFGTLPLIVSSPSPAESLKAYVDFYLKEEIQREAIVRNLSGFIRFLPVAALMHGQTMNLSNLARDAEVQRPTLQGFFSILEDTLLVRRLEAFSSKLRVREKQKPKFYFIDAGLARACKNAKGEVQPEEKGSLFEGLIYMTLLAQQEFFNEIDAIQYWSPAETKNTEVDFLVSKNNEKIAIEVKAKTSVSQIDYVGLKAIADLPQLTRRILVYMGSTSRQTSDGIEIMPFKEFAKELETRRI